MKQKVLNIINKNPDIAIILSLSLLFYLIFFHNIGSYFLMDADETRYISMARDMFNSKEFLTLYLNNEFFFEKPPLFFWIECLSFTIFGKINEFTARFPIALLGSIICFSNYFIGKKILSRTYGLISSLILATSIEFFVLSKLAILDTALTFFITLSIYTGITTFFCRNSRKKYFWWLFYIFSGLAVMTKGIPGFIIPFGSMFFIAIYSKKFKEILKPQYTIPGIILFLLIILPWHILMCKLHNPLFWNEYIIKHHLARFLGSEIIHRSEPFYFYFLVLLWGFCPWILSYTIIIVRKFVKNLKTTYENITIKNFIHYNAIIIIFTLLFFTSSETKLITYILPLFPALSYMTAYIWLNYIKTGKNANLINITNYLLGTILLIISTIGILAKPIIPKQILIDLGDLRLFSVLMTFAFGLSIILFTKKKLYLATFMSIVLFFTIYSALATKNFFELDYKFGQNDLIHFAKIAEKHNVSLTTYKFGTKYSLIYYGTMPVIFGPQTDILEVNKALKIKQNYVIIRNKDLKDTNGKKIVIISKGRKFSLIVEKGENLCTK